MSQLSKAKQVARKRKALLQVLELQLRGAIELAIEEQFRPEDGKLFNEKGKLRKSPGEKGLAEDLKRNTESIIGKDGITFTITSKLPYAEIQDKGGVIKATPTQNSRGVKTYKMAQYFWYKFATTTVNRRKEFYKIMALSVQKKGGVKIKGRDYMKGILKDFEKLEDQIIEDFLRDVLKIYA